MNKNIWVLSPIFLALVACGGGSDSPSTPQPVGGGGGGDTIVDPLDLPDTIGILRPNGDPIPKRGMFKTGTDYTDDTKRIHVWDEAMQPLEMVNEILCYVGQTGADQLVNETYTALIDGDRCRNEDESEDTGQSSGGGTEYELWTIQSSRESNSSPQIVKIWVPGDSAGGEGDPMDQQNILVEVSITSEGDETSPYGQFIMNWKGVVNMQGQEFQTMSGTIQAALDEQQRPNVLFFNHGGSEEMGFSFTESTSIVMDDADATSGVAKTHLNHQDPWGSFGADFSVAYDPDYYLRLKTSNQNAEQRCLSRTEFDQMVWRYNLYNLDDESRVELNSGFPFYADVNNQRYFGHVGYWGMWLPDEVDKSTVTRITRQDFENDQTSEYDVVHGKGKLMKRTKTTVALAEIEGVLLQNGDNQVEYTHDLELNDGTAVDQAGFYAIAEMQWDESGQMNINPITPTLLTDQFLHFWSETLGGDISYNFYDDPNSIKVYEMTFVRSLADIGGDAISLELDCYHQCLKSNITQDQFNFNGDQPYFPESQDPSTPTANYSFDFDQLTLVDGDGNPVALADGVVAAENSPNFWGIHTGAMVTDGTQLSNSHDVWSQDITYIWETGPNNWNTISAVKAVGSNTFESFDRPMDFVYNHTTANDLNADDSNPSPQNGQTFMLHYGGDGELWGIPHRQTQNGRWSPLFSLKDGTVIGNDYKVKGIEVEQRLRVVDMGDCDDSGLTLDAANALTLPSEDDLTPVTINWSDKPVVNDSPRVIGGVVQG